MKTKRACGFLMLSVLGILLAPFPVQAETETLEWVQINKPGLSGNIVVRPSEVSEIVVGRSGTIYALDSSNSRVYRSLNEGSTWDDITSPLVSAGAVLPASKIAVAPDDSNTIAVVTNAATAVYLSTNRGVTWTKTNVPSLAGTIQAMTISRQYTQDEESLREIAIGTAVWGDNTTSGQVWVFQVGKFVASWQNQSFRVDPGHQGGEVSAIAYSPGYQRDNTLIVVASTANDVATSYQNKTWLSLGKRDTKSGTTSWVTFTGYPVEIATTSSPSAGDAPGVSRISSSLALPSNYSSRQELSQQLFVSYDRNPDANDDVYRLNDTSVYRLNTNGGTNIDLSSIAYYGTTTSGKLLAGEVSPVAGSPTVQVRRTSDPFESPPTWNRASMPPTGPGNAKISWSPEGDLAYVGTSQSPGVGLDESAFSMSSDDGDNWQQVSLMDTTIMLSDIVPAPDSATLFIATYSSLGPEGIWRSARTRWGLGAYWSRQLTMATTSNRVILRLSPNYASDYTIYAAEVGGNLMAVSHNRGNSWQWRYAPKAVIDLAVEDEDTVYVALPGGYIRKSTNNVWSWIEAVYTNLSDINMLTIAERGTILVGGRNGEVAYSPDGGTSFTKIHEVIGNGDVQIVADSNHQKNGMIYAATDVADSGIWRWVIGRSTTWEQIDESITTMKTGQRVGGLVISAEGVLHALRLEPASRNTGGMTRSLNPSTPNLPQIEFNVVNQALPEGTSFNSTAVFSHALPYLKLSGGSGQNELWTVDTANEIIYRFQDSLSRLGPVPDKPTNGAIISAVTRDGGIYPTLSWTALSRATKYEVAIYLDAASTQRVWSDTSNTTALVITTANRLPLLAPGATYYWRVRVVAPVKSPWSETWSLATALAGVWSPLTPLSPQSGASNVGLRPAFTWNPANGATGYEFVLARDSEFTSMVIALTDENTLPTAFWGSDEDLDYATTYFWKVRAISATSHSEWETGVFTTIAKPVTEPPVVVQPVPTLAVQPPSASSPPSPPQARPLIPTPMLWVTIGVGVTLVITVLTLIVRLGK